MPKLNIYGERWKYKIGKSAVVITSPDGEQYVASHNEVTCDFSGKRKNHNQCIVKKEDVREYIEAELL